MQQGLLYDKKNHRYVIHELEVSINNQCNLQCNECGFHIPSQKQPYLIEPISEIVNGIYLLKNLQIHIEILVVVGGEPLLNKPLLENAVKKFKQIGNINTIEVVSNGLYPQGLSRNALKYIDQFTISKYFQSDLLISLWKKYINLISPKITFNIRNKTDKWDKWWGNYKVDSNKAQKMYNNCFYRRHCITIERQRLFPCSRIAKKGKDEEGLDLINNLSNDITLQKVKKYLNSPQYFPSCIECTPMMGMPKVKGGIQPDNRIKKLTENAIIYLNQQIKVQNVDNKQNTIK